MGDDILKARLNSSPASIGGEWARIFSGVSTEVVANEALVIGHRAT
ncbi:hypothetical protein DB30_07685 [Enhygromyxa salina]|uniref:Uncharacterized protein n=1 Tax=Enhygromyxa salina TaxID=215803 RepID=A0A0C2DB24_9BACT|nr:hypothetical protein [Enhygromyxa salina]KIG18670.1 hypothetical protein DB30_07685 [Enhygromyxa salina]